jgi:hypothetical protein
VDGVLEEDFTIFTKKHPSPLENPAIQLGSIVFGVGISDLLAFTIDGKAAFKSSDRPQFIEALIVIIFLRPSIVKCSLLLINS